MEELDLLKKDWNKKDHFPNVSEDKIYGMLHKNSSSNVKWIFIISMLELSLGIVLGVAMSFTKFDEENVIFLKKIGIYNYYEVFMAIMYAVIVYFIVRFYLMYKKVSTTDNVKQLMQSILKTRKTVQHYILFNLVAFAIGFITLASYSLKVSLDKTAVQSAGKIAEIPSSIYIVSFIAMLLVTAVLTGGFWIIYRLIYGFLLKRLKKNFEELKKIDL